MKQKGRNKQETGVTLLALVITIIVLLILAGITISAVTGDNGIIKNAGQAKEETEIANEKEIVEKSTVQAMGNNKYGNIEESELQSELDKETNEGKTKATDVGEVIKVTFIDTNRNYAVDKDGNVREMTWWETSDEEGNNYVTNGEHTLQIGDYITYNANDKGEYSYTAEAEKTGISGEGQTFSSNYETTWRLLGVEHSAEGDNLMIVPSSPIQSTNSTGLALCGVTGYQYGVGEIENISQIYGHGMGASYARAMIIDDINEITGYNPMCTGNGTVYKQGEALEYLNEITVTRTSHGKFEISCSNGAKATYTYTGFRYFNENNENVTLGVGESITLTCTYYKYYPTTLTDSSTGGIKGIDTSSREYETVFSSKKNYWLASKYALGGNGSTGELNVETNFSLFSVRNGVVETPSVGYLIAVGGNSTAPRYGIMPIVYLDKNIQLEETGNQVNSCTEWKINE